MTAWQDRPNGVTIVGQKMSFKIPPRRVLLRWIITGKGPETAIITRTDGSMEFTMPVTVEGGPHTLVSNVVEGGGLETDGWSFTVDI